MLQKLLPKPNFWERVTVYLRRRWKEVTLAVIFALAAGFMLYTWALAGINRGDSPEAKRQQEEEAAPVFYSPLTGLEVPEALTKRPVTAVMIENSPDARPQTSLSQAGVVFEAVAEGGITRFLALYQEAQPGIIGPVRSLRPYYLDWGMGFDANIAHAGGSGHALSLVKQRKAKSMNGLVFGQGYYRVGDRVAPHNMYTSAKRLDGVAKSLGYLKPSKFDPYTFIQDDQPARKPTATKITMDFSGPIYAAQWRWGRSTNSYVRFIAGAPDKDRANNKQIRVKNLVVIPMRTSYVGSYAVMDTVGRGNLIVFRDGRAIKGTWKKATPRGQLKIMDLQGKEISLNAGSTWFAVVPAGRSIRY